MASREVDPKLPQLAVTIDRMRRQDIPEVMRIERASFPDPWEKLAFERETINSFSKSVVARDPDGRLVGYTVYWAAGPEYHILNIAVPPELRGQGVGRALMDRAIADARADKAEFVALEVRTTNTPAKTLYRSYGFVTVGVRPKYYKNGEDAEVMLLQIRG